MISAHKPVPVAEPMMAGDDPLLADAGAVQLVNLPITAVIDIPYPFARKHGVVVLGKPDGALEAALRVGSDRERAGTPR